MAVFDFLRRALPAPQRPVTIHIMFDFGVRRLPRIGQERRYHLFDDQGQLVLVGDYQTPWLENDPYHHLRLARPDGKLVATLDMTDAAQQGRAGASGSYAIIYDYAVYGILNTFRPGGQAAPYFAIEVEGQRWLALAEEDDRAQYALYSRVPARLGRDAAPDPRQLGDPIGSLRGDDAGYAYTLALPARSLRQRELLALALVFLIDRE